MTGIIQLLIIVIFCVIVAKKYIIPRIVSKRAAKNGALITSHPIPEELQMALLKGDRKVTGFEMRWVELTATDEQLEVDLRAKANEILMLASARGTDVRLNIVQMGVNLLVYVTYAV